MPSPMDSHSEGKWSEIWVLFDDGKHSVISGMYQGDSRRRLGQRSNGPLPDRPLGFPIDEMRRASWYVVPEFLEIPILHALLDEVAKHPGHQTGALNPTELILKELKNRYKT